MVENLGGGGASAPHYLALVDVIILTNLICVLFALPSPVHPLYMLLFLCIGQFTWHAHSTLNFIVDGLNYTHVFSSLFCVLCRVSMSMNSVFLFLCVSVYACNTTVRRIFEFQTEI